MTICTMDDIDQHLISLLRQNARMNIADLAHKLEVSARTVYRDIAELQAQGVPIDGVVPDPALEADLQRRQGMQRALAYMDLQPGQRLHHARLVGRAGTTAHEHQRAGVWRSGRGFAFEQAPADQAVAAQQHLRQMATVGGCRVHVAQRLQALGLGRCRSQGLQSRQIKLCRQSLLGLGPKHHTKTQARHRHTHALAQLAKQTGQQAQALALLQACHDRAPSLDVTEALAHLSADPQAARSRYLSHLEREPSLVMATQWLAGETLSEPHAQTRVQAALELASAPLKRYRCAACGFEARQHFWQCPGCQAWDSYPARRVEEL